MGWDKISPIETLMNAMVAKEKQVKLYNCRGSLNSLFRKVLDREPRLLAYISGYESLSRRKNLFLYDYEVTINYHDDCPENLDEVILDPSTLDLEPILGPDQPKPLYFVVEDSDNVSRQLTKVSYKLSTIYEGISGWNMNVSSIDEFSNLRLCKVTYIYLLPTFELKQLQAKAKFEAKKIWRKILGRSKVPQFVKPFLAFSYLSQECQYDQRALDEVISNPHMQPSDPIPHLAYGPLVEFRGICGGFAWAFKTLMDEANVECMCVNGKLEAKPNYEHMWNLVKLDGQYYHIDPSYGMRNDGVFINGLFRSDTLMEHEYVWDTSDIPKARGMKYDYLYIEDFLVINGKEYLDDGANEKYFFPDKIVE